jgi:transposase-like protein
MATGRGRGDRERYWHGLLQTWRQSGLTVRAFCEQQDVSEPSFYTWRRALQNRAATTPDFVPVRIIPEPAAEPTTQRRMGDVELVLADGRLLRVGPGFDAATLKRVLVVLAEGQPC